MAKRWLIVLIGALCAQPAFALKCGEMEIYNETSNMCEGRAWPGMSMDSAMVMLHENIFGTQIFEEGARGRNAFAAPHMIMGDFGRGVGNRQYVNLDLMLTAERWTFPQNGSPELLQIGEEKANGEPFLDAQHPHSSPIMGLTLSDTISLSPESGELKLFFAPRGEATEGPISFMHRATGEINPSVPLGHHIGQDVGHISSTVTGAMLHLKTARVEVSTYNGQEPEPTRVDLKTAAPNSYAVRVTEVLTPHVFAMGSAAYVRSPESDDPDLHHVWRYSASLYTENQSGGGWLLHTSLIWGLVNFYDHVAALNSFTDEALLQKNAMNIWARLEILQRSSAELGINNLYLNESGEAHWVTAVTLGYSQNLRTWNDFVLRAGGSITKDVLPRRYQPSYSGNPLSGQVFLQLTGMTMFEGGS